MAALKFRSDQMSLPRFGEASQAALAQRASDMPLRPKVAQQAPEGLFGDTAQQTDLIDVIRQITGKETP
jgi:hypothetical protein